MSVKWEWTQWLQFTFEVVISSWDLNYLIQTNQFLKPGWGWPNFLKDSKPTWTTPDSKVYGANMGPIWGRQDPGGPHVGPMKFRTLEH